MVEIKVFNRQQLLLMNRSPQIDTILIILENILNQLYGQLLSARQKEMAGEERQWREIGVESEQLFLLK